eukprot:SAG31_NODE_41383_length_276_cov_0.858757_2_plen_53_part_01
MLFERTQAEAAEAEFLKEQEEARLAEEQARAMDQAAQKAEIHASADYESVVKA